MPDTLRFGRLWIYFAALLLSGRAVSAADIPRFLGHTAKPGPAGAGTVGRPGAFDLNSLPVYFEKDPAGSRFQARTANSGLLFDTGGFWLGVGTGESSVRVKFQGARRGVGPAGQGPLAAHSNYYAGNDPRQWSSRQHFAGVRYDALWPGVDLIFYAQHRELEYDFDVAPHADPFRIRLQVEGADTVTIDEQGDLWIATPSGKARQHRPVMYQEIDGRRVKVAGGYRLAGKNRVAFRVGDYDHSRKLVIDPVLEFSTYLSGSGFDVSTAVAVDHSNNIYVTGYTQFADFKTTPAGLRLTNSHTTGPNVFVVKLDAATRQIDYINFWGGSLYDFPWKVTVDANGFAWVVGETLSSDIPLINPILSRPQLINLINGSGQAESYGFVARFAPNGSLTYSTYTAPGVLYGVAINSTGAAWVVGSTICYIIGSDVGNPAFHEFQPTSGSSSSCSQSPVEIDETGYVMRLAPTGSVQYSAFFVPNSGNGQTNGISDVAIDQQDNAYIAGTMVGQYSVTRAVLTNSGYINQPDPNLACEVTKLNSSGQQLWTQTLQGRADQECLRIATDSNSNVYITGYTTSTNFPVTAGAFQTTMGSPGTVPNVQENPLGNVTTRPLWDAFAAEYNSNGSLLYSSYLGGTGDDYGFGIAVNSSGNAFITGYTNSPNFPVTPGAVQTAYGGGQGDAYVTGFSANGTQLVNSSFFGGSGQDEGYQVAVDTLGNLYLAGATASANLPLTSDAVQNKVQNVDGMLAKFNLQACGPTLTVANPILSAASGSATLTVTTDVPGCAWTLAATSTWLQFNPASGNGSQTVAMAVAANTSTQSRLAIITANSRRSFVYQAGQTNCQFVFTPGEMALPSTSVREFLFVQSADSTCTWSAASDQPWLHILSSAGGPGSGTITIGTDQNTTSAVRTGHVQVGSQTIIVGQSAGGCVIIPSAGANSFGPAGGIGTATVLTGSSLCSWQAQSQNPDWIQLPSSSSSLSYGRGTIRFSVLPNSTGAARAGAITVGGQNITINQDSQFNSLETLAGDYPSSELTGASSGLAPAVRARTNPGTKTTLHNAVEAILHPRNLGDCGSVAPATPIQLDTNGDPVTVTIVRKASGCSPTAGAAQTGSWLHISAPSYPSGSSNVTFTLSADPNITSTQRSTTVGVNAADSSQLQLWYWAVNQAGTSVVPLSIQTPNELQPQASSAAIPVTSANPNVSSCTWSVDPNSAPSWITLTSAIGTCGSQLQFTYGANTTNSTRKAILQFTSGDQTELDQPAAAPTPCTYSFQETTPQSIGAGGGPVTLHVATATGCTWSPSTDSSGWITFPQGTATSGPGALTVQVAPNATTSQQMAQIFVGNATAYISQAAGSFPAGCVYTLSPTSQAVPNTGGTFSFQVQTAATCSWQPSQPPADAGYVHLQSAAQVTGPGTVSFTVDGNSAGSAARSSTITVALGVSFSIAQDPGPSPTCSYTLVPASNAFAGTGGSFSFQVQTTPSCAWQPSQPAADASWVHLQSTAAVTGPGTVNFAVDPNPALSPARSSSIGVASATFTITEAAGPGNPAPVFAAAGVVNGASFQAGAVSPGELVTINGSGLGPAQGVSASLANGAFPTSWSGTQVLFNGVPAPIIYTSAVQVNAVVPYSLAGSTSAQVQVSYNSALSSAVTVGVAAASPALFSLGNGTGPGAILHSNFSLVTSSNPAVPGETVILFATGAGQTTPPGVDGQLSTTPLPVPVLPVSLTIGGQNATLPYTGAAPGLIAGLLQINATIPAGLQGSQPILLSVGNFAGPAGVTIPLKGTAPVPTGTLTATPNPLNVCSATSTATVTLSWSSSNVTSVEVVAGPIAGAVPAAKVVATGGPAGSVKVVATPNTTYYLLNTSAGLAPTSTNSLAMVTLLQGTCPSQPGVAPPTADLAQNVNTWQFQFSNNGSPAQGGAVNDTSPSDILDGSSSMYVYSTSGTAILMTLGAPATGWDFSKISNILLSMQSDVTPGTWNSGTPSFKLTSANGSLTLSPVASSSADNSYYGWLSLTAPLAGNSTWRATTSGQFNVHNVTSIQIDLSVSETNWAVILNAMFLK